MCDVIGIAQYLALKSKMAAMYFALFLKFKAFSRRFAFENGENRNKTDLVTQMLLNTGNLN